MKLAWLGFPAFRHHMPAQGFDTAFVALPKPRVLDFEEVCQAAGFVPDAVVYADRSFPPPLAGVELFPCLTCFYCVDSHIHSWYPAYAQGFDCCAVSLRDHLPWFTDALGAARAIWLPPFPRDEDRPAPGAEKIWDALFVGKVDAKLTPARHAFLAELGELTSGLHVTRGTYRELFPQARVVLNVAERGDLNFRVFEALACGSCLLTPRVGHGQEEMLPAGECLEVYESGDAADAARRIAELLAAPERRETLAQAGAARIEAEHRMHHRAATLAGLLRSGQAAAARAARLARPVVNHALKAVYLHWAEALGEGEMRDRYLAVALRRPSA